MKDGTGVLEMKYLIQDVDAKGNVRFYFRKSGQRKIRLRAKYGTPELLEEYRRAAHGLARPDAHADYGSILWLVRLYYQSAEFRRLAARTRHVRKLVIDRICQEIGSQSVGQLAARHIRHMRDQRADAPEAANAIVKALRQVFGWAMSAGHVTSNPAREVPYLSGNPEGHHTWAIEEVRQYETRHPIGTKARVALAILLFTGARRSDAVRLGRQMIKDGILRFREAKGEGRKIKERSLPVLPELQSALDAGPVGDLTFLVTAFGRPFTANGFGNWFRKRCDEAGLKHCSAHGLRKAGATILAENGATEAQLMAIYGWESSKEASRYTRAARRNLLASDGLKLMRLEQKEGESVPVPASLPQAAKSS